MSTAISILTEDSPSSLSFFDLIFSLDGIVGTLETVLLPTVESKPEN